MRTFFVIKNFYTNEYYSNENDWDNCNRAWEFDSKQEAISFMEKNHYEPFIIEEINIPTKFK